MSESTKELVGLDLDLAVAQAVDLPCTKGGSHDWRASLVTSCQKCQMMLPLFSKSIEAAMQIVEKMRERGFAWAAYSNGKGWKIQCYLRDVRGRGQKFSGGLLPELLCRAALSALEQNNGL